MVERVETGMDSCVRTLVAFKPRSAFKLASMPIHAPLYSVPVFSLWREFDHFVVVSTLSG